MTKKHRYALIIVSDEGLEEACLINEEQLTEVLDSGVEATNDNLPIGVTFFGMDGDATYIILPAPLQLLPHQNVTSTRE